MAQPPVHPSDSVEQRLGETTILTDLSAQLGFPLAGGETITFSDGSCVKVDGVNREHRYLCEIYCRLGFLQAAQVEKVASDILKLMLVERMLGGEWRKVCCFADERAARVLRGRSWLATAARVMSVEAVVVALPPELHQSVMAAQQRQVMVNKPIDNVQTPSPLPRDIDT